MCCQPIVSSERKPFSQARRIGVLISALALLLGAGCSSGGSDSGEVVSPPPPPPAPTSAAVTFVVVDETGSPIEGSTVDVVGSALSGITDTSGQTTMTIPYTDRLLLSASADGYSDKLQAANVPNGASAHDVVVMLIRRSPAVTIPNIEGGGTATGPNGVTITFPPGALVDSTGQPVVGDVQMFMTPVDVTGPDVAAFPGLFFGVDSNGSDQLLLSHGVAEFVVQQGSETLNIASGQTATVEVPLYADGNADGSAVMVGDLIPFWSLNEATGVWLEEALGEVVASNDSPTGLAVVATVSHFSWWNIDVPSLFHTLNLTVVGPTACIPAGSRATISAEVAQSARTPGTPIPPVSRASVSLYVPTQLCADGVTRTLSVPANLNILVDVVVRVGTTHYSGSTTVGGPAGETSDTTLVLMAMTDPQPSITTPANGSIIQAGNRVAILVEVGGPAPDRVEIYAGSTLLDDVDAAQPFYRVDWETTNESPGEVSISAVATLNGTGYPATPVGIEIEPAPAMPVITTNVQDVTVLEGENATFTVSASGGYLQYGWQQSVDGGATFFPVGFNQPNVTFNAVPAWADGQRVRVAVSNSVGSVSSRVALLTVNSLPQVIVVPASAGAVAGQNVTFTAQASGTAPLSYQWQRSDNNGTTWAAIAAATNSSYTFATSLADAGALFRAQVNNPFGGATS
ncbi:MAG TPA: Ig-like domain-containing protein, partial [Woeseiaceae bacterium]|nr:Ig-like domain-containing protein [Woeseiaceae bacterium]